MTAEDASTSVRVSRLRGPIVAIGIISLLGLLGLIIGDVIDAKGFSDDAGSGWSDLFWSMMALGFLVTLVLSLVAWARRRGARGNSGDAAAAKTGFYIAGLVFVANVVFILIDAL